MKTHKRFLPVKLSKEDQKKLDINTYSSKQFSFQVVTWLVTGFELFMMISNRINTAAAGNKHIADLFFFLYASLFGITIICMIALYATKNRSKDNPGFMLAVCLIYSFCICYWGSHIAAITHRNYIDISVFLYVVLCVSIIVPMKHWQAVLLYSSNWILFMLLMQHYISPALDPFSSTLNSAIASLLAIAIAVTMQRTRINDYLNTKTILEQNEQIQEMNTRLNAMVTLDTLTQINNRRFIEREFPAILENARDAELPLSMMMLDVDMFKMYNDRYGHQSGDDCLYRIAEIVSARLPEENAYFVRYGGEEFLIFLVGIEPQAAYKLADDIRAKIFDANIMHEDAPQNRVTVSLGVCCSRGKGESSLSQLIHYADSAMYEAKNAGRNRISVFNLDAIPKN